MTKIVAGSKSVGGRPANPTPTWDPKRKRWTVRVTMRKPIGWPSGKEAPREEHDLSASIREDQIDQAKAVAKRVSDRLRRGEAVDPSERETVAQWAVRRYRWLATRPRAETLENGRRSGSSGSIRS